MYPCYISCWCPESWMFWVKTLGGLSKKRRNGPPQPTCHGRAAACGFACCFTGADMRTPQSCEAEAVTFFFFFTVRYLLLECVTRNYLLVHRSINYALIHILFVGGTGWTEPCSVLLSENNVVLFHLNLSILQLNYPQKNKISPSWAWTVTWNLYFFFLSKHSSFRWIASARLCFSNM